MGDRLVAPVESPDDARFDRLFRPNTLDEYIGQTKHKENLKVFVEAARRAKSRSITSSSAARRASARPRSRTSSRARWA
jgi:hypothetical protein